MEPRPSKKDLTKEHIHHGLPVFRAFQISTVLDFLASSVGWEEIFSYVHEKTYQSRLVIESMNRQFGNLKKRD